MSPKIDSQMRQILQRAQSTGENNAQISQSATMELIRRAQEINETHSSSFRSETRKGNIYLSSLMNDQNVNFSDGSRDLIQKYISLGKIPKEGVASGATFGGGVPAHSGGVNVLRPGISPSGGGSPIASHGPVSPRGGNPLPHSGNVVPPRHGNVPSSGGGVVPPRGGNVPTSGSGVPSVTPTRGGNTPVSGGSAPVIGGGVVPPRGGNVPGTGGGTSNAGGVPSGTGAPIADPGRGRPHAGTSPAPTTPPTVTTPTTPVTGGGAVGTTGPHGTCILDFTAKKSTFGCHWFPMQETRPGGDPTNNLYAEGGPLDKLDKLTGGNARQYEWDHNRKAVDAGKEYSWWGHCNNASEAACILREPQHGVVMTARDGTQIKFTRNDIQGLLVKCTASLVDKVDFRGERFNTASRDDPNDPYPTLFLSVMKEWASDGIPFVLDIDRLEQVWNFPYDRCKIFESQKIPEGVTGVPSGSKYYHIEMSGTGFPEKSRIYECWVAEDGSSNWIKTPNTHNNPDFMWRPHPIGDVMDKSLWQPRGRPNNPEVDMQIVYEIYMKSLA